MPSIEIIVSPAGQSEVQTKGFDGATCRLGSQFIERALGQTMNEQLTSEFYQAQLSSQASETECV
ncbi:MAG: hypothetical protein JWM11_5148 [Planctomycetaceae bacterium]|nr:hypothetical protein [Planctomycetaceae bacterium]